MPNRPAQQRGQDVRLRLQHPLCGIYLRISQHDLQGPDPTEIRAADRVVRGVEMEGERM